MAPSVSLRSSPPDQGKHFSESGETAIPGSRTDSGRSSLDPWKRYSFAYYVAGYAVECALKSCLLSRMIHTGWIFQEKAKVEDCLTHDFGRLIRIAGLLDDLNETLAASAAGNGAFAENWVTTTRWKVTDRYESKTKARSDFAPGRDYRRTGWGLVMDQELLVREQIEDGDALLTKLVGDGLDVTVAFWAKLTDGGLWYLFLAMSPIHSQRSAGLWRSLSEALQQIRSCSITFSDIRLIPATDPAALAALEASNRNERLATRYDRPMLGDLAIDGAYLYPRRSEPIDLAGVVASIAGQLAVIDPADPVLIILKDGSQIYATPLGLQKTSNGVDVILRDVDTGLDRSVSAEDVSAIQSGHRIPRLRKVVANRES